LVNRLYEQLFHVSRRDMLGKSDHEVFPHAMAETFRKNDLVVLEAGVPLQFEEVAPHDDGPHTYVSVKFPILDAGGKTVALCGIATDITEMKRAEREMRDREARLQAVMDTALDGIILMDENRIVRSFNIAATRLFGYAAEEVIGQNINMLMPEPYRSEHDSYVLHYLETGEKKVIGARREVRGRKKDGSEFPFELSVSELDTESGRIFTGMVHDISDRKRAEEDLKRSNEELEQFAYVASHDLKEPLRMISSYLQIIEKRYADKLDDEGREFFGFAKDGARRMRNLIEDLLEYARVGTRGRAMEPADSGRVVDDVCADLQISIAECGATITRDPLPIVAADAGQLRKVFQNFLANAIKFRRDDPPKIHVSAHRQNKDWVFSVSDNGIGIPPEHQERIFVIFQRLHTRERYEGTGIGLAVCKKIVERHGGRVWLESTPGVGTTFYFTLHAA
jgi:PAS domain S-box-containing protein